MLHPTLRVGWGTRSVPLGMPMQSIGTNYQIEWLGSGGQLLGARETEPDSEDDRPDVDETGDAPFITDQNNADGQN